MNIYNMKIQKLKKLALQLKNISTSDAWKKTNNLADIMASKKKEIDSPKDLFKFLEKNKDLKINIDSPKGSKKGFGNKKRVLPFDYGEIVGVINPADNMGWDIIFPPSEKPTGKNLTPIGIIKINDDKEIWKERADKAPPIGNDKIIVSADGIISDEDRKIISDFFETMWQFKKIKWMS
jgi:hypothetical protein